MGASYVDDGSAIELVATTARVAGAVVIYADDTIGIVADTVALGERYNAWIRGKFQLAKNTGLPFAPGEDVYWDGTELTTVASSNTRIGVVARAASTTASKARILLNQPNVLLEPQT
jgi:predicted RecA/RadA family phage recombinase